MDALRTEGSMNITIPIDPIFIHFPNPSPLPFSGSPTNPPTHQHPLSPYPPLAHPRSLQPTHHQLLLSIFPKSNLISILVISQNDQPIPIINNHPVPKPATPNQNHLITHTLIIHHRAPTMKANPNPPPPSSSFSLPSSHIRSQLTTIMCIEHQKRKVKNHAETESERWVLNFT